MKLTERGLYWLKVDVANTFGHDKLLLDERVQWVDDHYNELEALIDEADSPWMFRNGVKALRDNENGRKINYLVALDASNQALQLYGILASDLTTSSIACVGSGDKIVDAYTMLSKAMNKALESESFNRKNCKKALMTTLYGKREGWTEMVEADATIGELYSAEELEEAFDIAMYKIAPNAMSIMASLQELNDEQIGTYYWTLPDGFNVKYDVKTEVESPINLFGDEFTVTKEVYGPSKYNAGMAPNVIHSVDGYIAREMIRRMDGKFISTIHDSFSCHPDNADEMILNYKNILVEINDSDLLQDIMSEIAGHEITVAKDNTLTAKHIMESTYALT